MGNRKREDYKSGNIFTIRSYQRQISDEDLNNLIMGLVSLIKKSTAHDIHNHYKGIISDYHSRLNNTIVELQKKDKLLLEVLEENQKLKGEKNIDSLYSKIKVD